MIYIAPPQYKEMWIRALQMIDRSSDWLAPDGIAMIQIDPKEVRDIQLNNLQEFDRRQYGSTMLWFFEKPGNEFRLRAYAIPPTRWNGGTLVKYFYGGRSGGNSASIRRPGVSSRRCSFLPCIFL